MRTATLLVACIASFVLMTEEASAAGQRCGVFDPPCPSSEFCKVVSITRAECTARRTARQSCGVIAGPCLTNLTCDILGECRHTPGLLNERCGTGVPCSSSHFCSSPIAGRCRARVAAGGSCTGIGQGTCQTNLVCDILGECRHSPPELGEPCGTLVPCVSSLGCSAEIAGRCEERDGSAETCSGTGQGSCQAGMVCDLLRECRHEPGELGELCGTGVPCTAALGCSAEVAGRCEERDASAETCSGVGQGSCQAGMVCDLVLRECRHEPGEFGELCGIGVPCTAALGCSAEVAGRCEERDGVGDTCSGFGQGSCEAGLVCDALRTCRHDPPELDEPCGPGVPCAAEFFCQPGSQQCKLRRSAGEGCSAFNQCMAGLSCGICLTEGCDHPLQCFPNANEGVITEQQCRAMYRTKLHQVARGLGAAMTIGAGDAIAAGIAESQEFGVVYGPGDRYGCFTTLCVGIDTDAGISFFFSLGLYNDYDVVAGSSTAFIESVGAIAGNFSTSQILARNSLNPFDTSGLIGTEDCFAIGPEDPVPFAAGVYICETVVDTVIGGVGQLVPAFCGDGAQDPGEGCDDNNNQDGDGCSAACTVEATCGDGGLDVGEGCDDNNNQDGDGCSAQCTVEPFCGDGELDVGEACDDGANLDADGCSSTCQLEDEGDLDGDGDVDQDDVELIVAARNTPASGPTDPRDLDGDGMITGLDARKLVLLCTREACAVEGEPVPAAVPALPPWGAALLAILGISTMWGVVYWHRRKDQCV